MPCLGTIIMPPIGVVAFINLADCHALVIFSSHEKKLETLKLVSVGQMGH